MKRALLAAALALCVAQIAHGKIVAEATARDIIKTGRLLTSQPLESYGQVTNSDLVYEYRGAFYWCRFSLSSGSDFKYGERYLMFACWDEEPPGLD